MRCYVISLRRCRRAIILCLVILVLLVVVGLAVPILLDLVANKLLPACLRAK